MEIQMRKTISLSTFAAMLVLAGCAGTSEHRTGSPVAAQDTPGPPSTSTSTSTVASASVNLAAASGSLASGQLKLMPMADGVHVTGTVGGLKPNSMHGFHIHEKGDCSAVDASSAGGHFNPAAKPHGRVTNPQHHAGDNDNLVANAEGVATVNAHFPGVVLGGGANDVIGKAVVVHADPDDYTSQPAGNAGARIACGVISAG
jgi:Cu-Zn family superoxide dismutase